MLTQAMYHARELAMTRMEEEADQLGADGVVGVRLDIGRYEWGADLAEFIAVGTAVKHRGGELHRAPNGRPFTSDLSGQDFATLLRAGYRPVGLVMGNCVYHVAHQGMRASLEADRAATPEMPNYTQALYEARELAMERMQTEADELQAGGIVGARIVERSHGWGSHVIEFFAIGTGGCSDEHRARDREAGAGAAADAVYGASPVRSHERCPTSSSSRRSTRTLGRRSTSTQFHERARRGARAGWTYETVRGRSPCRTRCSRSGRGAIGSENVPNGPVILAPNHALVHGPLLHRRVHPPAGPVHGQVAAVQGPRAASWIFSHGGVFPVRRGHQDEEAFIDGVRDPGARRARSSCTARAGARGPARSPTRRGPGSGGSRSSRALPSSRWRSSAPTRCATGSGCSSRR